MTTRTITGIFDLLASTGTKYFVVNDFLAKLEALAVTTSRGEIITSPPTNPSEGATYLCNAAVPGLNNTGSGSFIRYTKPSNSNSVVLIPQIFQGVEGLSPADDWILSGGTWKLKTDPSVYSTNVTTWPDTLVLKVTSALSLTTSTGQTNTLNGLVGVFPLTLPIGVYQIVNGSNVVFRKLN